MVAFTGVPLKDIPGIPQIGISLSVVVFIVRVTVSCTVPQLSKASYCTDTHKDVPTCPSTCSFLEHLSVLRLSLEGTTPSQECC